MTSKELMSWDSANRRWIKNTYLPGNKRKMVAVSARQLAKLYPDRVTAHTKDGTRGGCECLVGSKGGRPGA